MKNLNFVIGQRGTPKLIVAGYSYVRNKGNFKTTYWRCSVHRSRQCKATVVTSNRNNRQCVTNGLHNHGPDYSELIDNDFENS